MDRFSIDVVRFWLWSPKDLYGVRGGNNGRREWCMIGHYAGWELMFDVVNACSGESRTVS